MTQHIESKTMPDFFGKRFDSNALKIAASVIVFIFLIPYTASLYNGLSSLFNIAFDIPYWVVIVIMAALTGLYVIFGGYMATAINDFIQGIIMLIGIVAVVATVLADNGGLMEAMKNLSLIESPYAPTAGMQGAFASFLGTQPVYLLFVVAGYLGSASDGGKILLHQERGCRQKGHHHLHRLRHCGLGRLLLPRFLWQTL